MLDITRLTRVGDAPKATDVAAGTGDRTRASDVKAIRNCVEASLLGWPQTGLRHKPDCGMSYNGFRRVGRVRGLRALEQRQCKT
jgi:hypothetical protein